MTEDGALAAKIEALLPRLMRKLWRNDLDDPLAELPLGQLRLVRVLDQGPRTLTDLAAELQMSASAATQLVSRLEETGLVEKEVDAEDRRVRHLRLTHSGCSHMAARRKSRVEQITRALERVQPDRRDAIVEALEELVEACRELESSPPIHA